MTELYCIDFDNTLTDEKWSEVDECRDLPRPDEEMIEKVNSLVSDGKVVIVWSARHPKEYPLVEAFLTYNNVRHHGIKLGKGKADKYVDDKMISKEELKQ